MADEEVYRPCSIVHNGPSGYKQAYLKSRSTDTSEMKQRLTQRIRTGDVDNKEHQEKLKKTEGEPDEEGWTLATRDGKHKAWPHTELLEKQANINVTKKQKSDYSRLSPFQRRVQKQHELNNLLHQFKADVSKVAEQRFKPN